LAQSLKWIQAQKKTLVRDSRGLSTEDVTERRDLNAENTGVNRLFLSL